MKDGRGTVKQGERADYQDYFPLLVTISMF